MKIYFCVDVILFAFVLVQSETEPDWRTQLEDCRKELEVVEDPFATPDFDDPKTKCLLACYLKKSDRLIEGKVSADTEVALILKYMPDKFELDYLKGIADECANKANEEKDDCAVAGALFKCFYKKFRPPST
ncbi:uncharacterized protein LOC131674069 [Phymastichus coffea]|uniref:uncharacterized protein LOC131674069 n=1 Tax=Phymastichus coffea TaxID=108790 RepID=UPI00273B85CA|nr:uncharacterized protein LOC131674069 [Phymastichus coffea]